MKTLKVRVKENPYPIFIGSGLLLRLGILLKKLKVGTDAVIVTNRPIRRLYEKQLTRALLAHGFSVKIFEVPDSEKSKSAGVAFRLIGQIAAYDTKKRIFVIAFGGGVVGDLAGYVAAVYKRGVPYVQVPTTLLAQIDSAIGGKVAIDLPVGKNLVGAFYQPKAVISDVSLLRTLSRRQIRNGLAEAVKYGVIKDARLFSFIEKNYRNIFNAYPPAMTALVLSCSKIKADVVHLDEKETKNIRTILNFGHTAGHAIETAGGYHRYHHGEAVALGMRIAADMACRLKVFPEKEKSRLNRLISVLGLPGRLVGVNTNRILAAMAHDKKFKAGKNRFVLPVKIGKVKVVEGISEDVIRQALKAYR